jgi:uncharacterized paraquat-inducible protein A
VTKLGEVRARIADIRARLGASSARRQWRLRRPRRVCVECHRKLRLMHFEDESDTCERCTTELNTPRRIA